LMRALTRLRRITETADDSSGVLGEACQRAADLHARSCREGKPEGRRLARWLAKFRDESPGWPIVTLSHYAPAFDERSLTVYRKAVAGLDEKYAATDRWKRFEVDRMRLELADHDGDVDRAIEILTAGEHPSFGAVIDRLRAAGRDSEVIDWMDRAVAADHVSGHMAGQGHDYWLDPTDVAEVYLAAERSGDAIAVLRRAFSRRPNASTFSELVSYAARLDRRDDERDWAIAEATRLAATPPSNGAVLVDIALSENDPEAAWAASDEFGPGHMWKQLASVSSEARPRAAADLYRREVERNLVQANTKVYAQIAEDLRTMRDLMSKAGDEADFAAFVSEVRETYHRRPSLMAALDRKGL
jgi:tetratricopeptide (TPR) repeat protein